MINRGNIRWHHYGLAQVTKPKDHSFGSFYQFEADKICFWWISIFKIKILNLFTLSPKKLFAIEMNPEKEMDFLSSSYCFNYTVFIILITPCLQLSKVLGPKTESRMPKMCFTIALNDTIIKLCKYWKWLTCSHCWDTCPASMALPASLLQRF